MKKVALIGTGKHGKNILRDLMSLGCDVFVGFHNKSEEKELWLKENYPNLKFTYDFEDIKNDKDVQDVFVATPMSTHVEVSTYFINAGKGVFVEKPISDSVKTALLLEELATSKGAKFMVGQIFLYHENLPRIVDRIKGKKIKSVSMQKTLRTIDLPHSSKELFLDSFVHEVSILLKLFGLPKNSSYDEDSLTLHLDFEDFSASTSLVRPINDEKIRRFEFILDEGSFLWQNDELFEKDTNTFIFKPKESTLVSELDIFLNRYNEFEEEIEKNNKISIDSVAILESIFT